MHNIVHLLYHTYLSIEKSVIVRNIFIKHTNYKKLPIQNILGI